MKKILASVVLVLMVLVLSAPLSSPVAAEESDAEAKAKGTTKCEMEFELVSTAVFYKKGNGSGKVTCDNGQSAEVQIKFHGGGITFGKDKLSAHGSFSRVSDISDLWGGYATAEASAGAQKSAGAQALWKGDVSLSLTGIGAGVNVGFSFGKFNLSPA